MTYRECTMEIRLGLERAKQIPLGVEIYEAQEKKNKQSEQKLKRATIILLDQTSVNFYSENEIKDYFQSNNVIIHSHNDLPSYVLYNKDGQWEYLQWYDHGKLNRNKDKPSRIFFYRNGRLGREEWFIQDQLHRDFDLPAVVSYDTLGNKIEERWYQNGELHRDFDQPSVITYNAKGRVETSYWYYNNNLHRDKGPAVIIYDSDICNYQEEYHIHGVKQSKPNIITNLFRKLFCKTKQLNIDFQIIQLEKQIQELSK